MSAVANTSQMLKYKNEDRYSLTFSNPKHGHARTERVGQLYQL